MDTNSSPSLASEHHVDSLQPALVDLSLGDKSVDLDPWQDSAPQPTHTVLHTPDPSLLDPETTKGVQDDNEQVSSKEDASAEISEKEHADKSVLDAFDPLVSPEERDAHDAWASSEGHAPPAPPPKSPKPILVPPSQLQEAPSTPQRSNTSPSSSTSGFPAMAAAFARSFNLPSLPLGNSPSTPPRRRPQSMDFATVMPTPIHAPSFAAQQEKSRTPEVDDEELAARGSPKRRSTDTQGRTASPLIPGLSSGRNSGTASPSLRVARGGQGSKDGKGGDPPFDFQKFLDQMKTKSAEPVAKYLKSFLSNFAKRTFTVTDQVKLINDFLNFISGKMREAEVWRNGTEAEFDNAMEGMEKLVMNRLYDFTFTPQVVRAIPPRPVTTDDLERDRVLAQRVALFGWIEPSHLDVPEGEGGNGFLMFAEQELVKINHYKAPRDKLICILNCCKVIFGLIRHLGTDESADSFIPILIFVVLKANPEHLLSNVEFIQRFRNPQKLQSEAGYYLSSLMGAVSFIETMDHTSLSNITQEEFESNVEAAIQSLPSSRPDSPPLSAPLPSTNSGMFTPTHSTSFSTSSASSRPRANPIPVPTAPYSHAGEEPATPLSLPFGDDAKRLLQRTGDTISKPLNAIGRIFSEVLDGAEERLQSGSNSGTQTPRDQGTSNQVVPIQTPYKPRVRRMPSPAGSTHSSLRSFPFGPGGPGGGYNPEETPSRPPPGVPHGTRPLSALPLPAHSRSNSAQQALQGQLLSTSRTPTPSLDISQMQEEIDRAHERANGAAKETLRQIFPAVDEEVLGLVFEASGADLGRSIEKLLEMASGE
ncbi:uncharacterized protein STEHIDRAFT_121647 [Stereum hirsutum FP-91666 SS1]|uniref:uncharacterized protein n=1 Tax=Stereum hirsutum (strain FP-91666) TaxID=721885 RepID=UPI0004449740|nr:uncharacterized protein STEHIDRAFT_121647 [Stereum hirsutum FP-91666 SS1]EIM86798.1 hypothetical protein STEHIDRAFT_121647 [Stereum hirsutum FP-91666 SS1]